MQVRQFGVIKKSSVFLFLLGALFIYNTSTFLRLKFNFYLDIVLYVAFVILTMSHGYSWRLFTSPVTIWFILSIATVPLFLMNGVEGVWMTYLAGYIHIFFWTAVAVFLMDNYSVTEIKKYVGIQTILLGVCEIATIRALSLYPLAARGMYGHADGISSTDFLHKMGCGGFGFIYGMVFLSLGYVSVLSNRIQTKKYKSFVIVALALALYTILHAGFSTAIILTAAGFACCFLYANNNKRWGLILTVLASMLIIVYARDIVSMVQMLMSELGVDIVSEKMGKILYALDTENIMSLTRFQVFSISVNGFLRNPIWGSGIAGTDSQLLDIFSYIGMFGVTYVGLLFSAFSELKRRALPRYIVTIQTVAILLATLNPFNDMTLMSMVFGFAPLIVFTAQNKNSERTDE